MVEHIRFNYTKDFFIPHRGEVIDTNQGSLLPNIDEFISVLDN